MKLSIRIKLKSVLFFTALLAAAGTFSPVYSEMYVPPGYAPGQQTEAFGYGLSMDIKSVEEDYYFSVTPMVELEFLTVKFGLQLPIEVLAYDKDPKSGNKPGSLREGLYSENTDYMRFIRYMRRGTHLYYDPDEILNWSFYYGPMSDGYLGHRTIIDRYVSTYDPGIYRAGFMADINNRWGGIEVFSSDPVRNEVTGGRAYIRPIGIFASVWNVFVASGDITDTPRRMLAVSLSERAGDPDSYNRGVFFQERIPRQGSGGALEQSTFQPLEEEGLRRKAEVKFEEYENPQTGKIERRPVPDKIKRPEGNGTPPPIRRTGERSAGTEEPAKINKTNKNGNAEPESAEETPEEISKKEKSEKDKKRSFSEIDGGFFSRWAIGYSIVKDHDAPLALETDGSGRLVVDPLSKRPRTGKSEDLTIIGIDTEFRMSPFTWLDLTPYYDLNKIKGIENAKGTHAGINATLQLGRAVKLHLRPEYREMTTTYIPVYFDSYYSLERTVYKPQDIRKTEADPNVNPADNITKLGYLKSVGYADRKIKGYYMGAMLDVLQTVVIDVSYEDYSGPDNSRVFTGFYVPSAFGVFLNGYYTKKYFNDYKDAYKFNENSLLAAEVGYTFYGAFYVKATVYRTWEMDDTVSAYKHKDEISFGFGLSSSM